MEQEPDIWVSKQKTSCTTQGMPPVQSVKALRRKNGLEQDGTNLNVYPYRLDNGGFYKFISGDFEICFEQIAARRKGAMRAL